MEPHYKPARRYIKTAMSKLENQQSQFAARQGKMYEPGVSGGQRKPALPELDDMEELLNMGTPKSAQSTKGAAPAADQPAAGERGN